MFRAPVVTVRVERHHDLELVLLIESGLFLRGRGEVDHRARLDKDGFFRATDDGQVVGVCACAAYPGGGLAWIGGMNVPPEHRRRGIARALLQACLDHAQTRHAHIIGLDATDMGRPLYLSEGFVDVGRTTRWARAATTTAPAPPPAPDHAVYPMSIAELAEVAAFDRARFGANRAPWIAEVLQAFPHRAFVAYDRASNAMTGFVLGQDRFVGPLVADDPSAAAALLAATTSAGTPAVLHVMDDHHDAVALARRAGLAPTDAHCLRMVRGGPLPGRPETQYALAAWALG